MERLGALLRSIRTEWGLSLREVKDRTELLAKLWGSPRYASSFGHESRHFRWMRFFPRFLRPCSGKRHLDRYSQTVAASA
jgi:hypothetical protein